MSKPTCHLLCLPHTSPTRKFDHCAYTSKQRKLATMLTAQGYRTVLYGAGPNEAECTEYVKVLSAAMAAML